MQNKGNEFYTEWEKGRSGFLKGDSKLPKNNFAMKLTCFIEAEGCTGFMARVVGGLDMNKG